MSKPRLAYPLINTLVLVITLLVNYLSNTGIIGEYTVGELSDRYPTMITPAGYAFGIWGFIYLWLLAFVGYQWYVWKTNTHSEVLRQTGWWFALANLANMAWVLLWTNGHTGFSVILMFVLLLSLVVLVLRLKMELWDAPVRILAFAWWPICWYLGWIVLASVTNVAAWLVASNWGGGPLSEQGWTILMIAAATLIYLLLTFSRNMREASLVGIWGLVAIAVKHWETNPSLVWTALVSSLILFAATSWHGYKNRYTAPLAKWKRGEI